MKFTAVKVFPEPVAIWMRARGRPAAKDFSRLTMASICAGQRCAVDERGHLPEAAGEGFLLFEQVEQGFGAVEGEDAPAARFGVEAAGEAGLGTGRFEAERQRRGPVGQAEGNAGDVFRRLLLDAGQGMAFRLGLDGAEGLAVYEEGVIGFAGLEGKLGHRDAPAAERLTALLSWTSQPQRPRRASMVWRARCSGVSDMAQSSAFDDDPAYPASNLLYFYPGHWLALRHVLEDCIRQTIRK